MHDVFLYFAYLAFEGLGEFRVGRGLDQLSEGLAIALVERNINLQNRILAPDTVPEAGWHLLQLLIGLGGGER